MIHTENDIHLPITEKGVEAFLASSFVTGIGPVYAHKIVEAYGADTPEIIEHDPERLAEVKGLGEAKVKSAVESIKAMKYPPRLVMFLFSCGIGDTIIEKILSHYRKHTMEVVTENPYMMVEDVWKLSFFIADKIGKALGITGADPRRLYGALLTSVKIYAENGSLYATPEQTLKLASEIAGVPEEDFTEPLKEVIEDERLIDSRGGLYVPAYYRAETESADKLAELVKSSRIVPVDIAPEVITAGGNTVNYTPLQREAINMAINNPVSILTGGPGTGKTTVLHGIIDELEARNEHPILVAPTGRAAKRMSELTGREAKTIHRLLGYRHGDGYAVKKVKGDTVIIDEGSMLEQVLFNHLLQSMPDLKRVIIVGDPDQLPAIGAGDVLRDMIASGTVPVVHLNENFRQAAGSGIARSAHDINAGLLPMASETEDFSIIRVKSKKEILPKLLEVVTVDMPARFGISPADIQVVTPQQMGDLGARQLNEDLRNMINPEGPTLVKGLKSFRLGDRVTQSENSSERNIYNGETGRVTAVDEAAQIMQVTFSDGTVSVYSRNQLSELSLAYATTVHKLQGSEADYVVMLVTMAHKQMLYRNLLYTGVSRARKACVLIGEDDAINMAVTRLREDIRNSNFKSRLQTRLIGA